MPTDTVGVSRAFAARRNRISSRMNCEWIITVTTVRGGGWGEKAFEFYPPRTNFRSVSDRRKAAMVWLMNDPTFVLDCLPCPNGWDVSWRPTGAVNEDADNDTRAGDFRLQKLDADGRFKGYLDGSSK